MGVPIWLLREYLVECGGRAITDDAITGAGWQAELAQLEASRVGSLVVGRVSMRLTGDASSIAGLRARLAPKLLRGGG